MNSKNENTVLANKIKLLTSQMDQMKDQMKKLKSNADSVARSGASRNDIKFQHQSFLKQVQPLEIHTTQKLQ